MSYAPLKTQPIDEEVVEGRAVRDKEEEWTVSSNIPGRARRSSRIAIAIKSVAFVLSLAAFFILGRTTSGTWHHSLNGNDTKLASLGKCPPDWKEAEEAGCVYDLVLSTWMHPRCFNDEMHDKYKVILRDMDFKYWTEPEMINEIPLETVETGEHAWVWTDGRFHHLHCAYALERIQAALMNEPIILDTICRNQDHLHHCLQYNGNPEWDDVKALNTTRIYNEDYLVDCLVG
ncbi:hypothetical protein E0Z10_g7540 [Xylaria hypoxylon]|uniref:Uncharacterized protein n=1 Tax=Xylaria hypoxylon TaxID=37992 RepID=A0A4Z0YUR7_9PEZI|nr:hypothetical protein E0Z10_g7540 [Xylaria hypoxylon]